MIRLILLCLIQPLLLFGESGSESRLINTEPRIFDFRGEICREQWKSTWIHLDRKKLLIDMRLWAREKEYRELDPRDSSVIRVAASELPQVQKLAMPPDTAYELAAFKKSLSDKLSIWMLTFSWKSPLEEQSYVAVGFVMDILGYLPNSPIDLTHLDSERDGFNGLVMVSAIYRNDGFSTFRSEIHFESLMKSNINS